MSTLKTRAFRDHDPDDVIERAAKSELEKRGIKASDRMIIAGADTMNWLLCTNPTEGPGTWLRCQNGFVTLQDRWS